MFFFLLEESRDKHKNVKFPFDARKKKMDGSKNMDRLRKKVMVTTPMAKTMRTELFEEYKEGGRNI